MKHWGWVCVVFGLGCSSGTEAPKDAPAPAATAPALPKAAPPQVMTPREVADDLPERMAKLAFKPDPYATQPGCVSEPKSTLEENLVLTVRLGLSRDAQGAITASDVQYHVSESRVRTEREFPASLGVPRLEFVRADGTLVARDFQGSYQEPGDAKLRRSSDETPRDPTWVKVWLASLPMSERVVAHRITLDGKVLSELKRPASAPTLSHIECDDTEARGVKLAWKSEGGTSDGPLYVDVMRRGPSGFIEELPLTDARKVDGLTLAVSPQGQEQDAILLVSLTDTFRLVSRGVLVPKEAL